MWERISQQWVKYIPLATVVPAAWQVISQQWVKYIPLPVTPPPPPPPLDEEEVKKFPWGPVALIGGGIAIAAVSRKPKKKRA